MKRIFSFIAVAGIIAATSCSSAEKAERNEENLADKIENSTNPDSTRSYVEQAKVYVQKLVSEGKFDEAREYLDKIQPVIESKAPLNLSRKHCQKFPEL